jgi:hypothetical protein
VARPRWARLGYAETTWVAAHGVRRLDFSPNLGTTTGYIAVYRDGERPTRVAVGTLVVAGLFLVVGAGLTAMGLTQRRRWRRVNGS